MRTVIAGLALLILTACGDGTPASKPTSKPVEPGKAEPKKPLLTLETAESWPAYPAPKPGDCVMPGPGRSTLKRDVPTWFSACDAKTLGRQCGTVLVVVPTDLVYIVTYGSDHGARVGERLCALAKDRKRVPLEIQSTQATLSKCVIPRDERESVGIVRSLGGAVVFRALRGTKPR